MYLTIRLHTYLFYRSKIFLNSKMSFKEEFIKVNVKQGTLIGIKSQLENGSSYCYFKGIPYAKPPVGNLRFKAPQTLENFDSKEIYCTKEHNISFQKNPFTNQYEGEEDCLYLNVYTPNLPEIQSQTGKTLHLPVLLWIHGGAFLTGSGNSDLYGPDYILEEDVVVVTINYRLGIFGFLSFPEGGIPGNAGLKDQYMALKWVSENIQNFNGDPNNITLFGESAGGCCVHYHYLLEKSRKYFHKAIIQSGTANMHWALQENPSQKARRLAELLGLRKTATDKEISGFLINYENIEEMYRYLYSVLTIKEKQRDILMPFRPCIEPYTEDAMVIEPFCVSIKNQNFKIKNIPIIFGCTSSEGIVNLESEMSRIERFNKPNCPRWVPYRFSISESDVRFSKIVNDIKTFYMNDTEVKPDNLNPFINFLGDVHFIYEFYKTIEQHLKYQPNAKVYTYKFSFVGELNLYKNMLGYKHLDGAAHADELFYLFKQTFLMNYDLKPETREHRISRAMVHMWTNFAKYGNPTPKLNNIIDFKWNSVKKAGNKEFALHFLEINDRIENKNNFWNERMKFWEDIEKTYHVNDRNFSKL